MNQKKIKILVFIGSFILLTIFLSFVNISKKINYYNINSSNNDSIEVQINFTNSHNLDKKEIQLYYSGSINSITPYSSDKRTTTFINNHIANFKFFAKDIPPLLRINFDKNIKETIEIEQISIHLLDQKIDINLKQFISHPSIHILKKKSNFIKIALSPQKSIQYDPYIYLENPLYIHKITTIEIILILIIISILSFIISELFIYLLNFKISFESINSILIFLLIISLLFREHWISKIIILISIYTLFLIFKKQIKLNNIKFYGFLLFSLYAVFSLLWSVNIGNSLSKLIGFLPFVIIPVWVSSFNSRIRYSIFFCYIGIVYMLISITTILFAFFRFNSSHKMSEFYYHTLSSPLSTNAIYLSLLYLMIFLFNLFFLLTKKKKMKAFSIFSLIVMFTYIVLLSSKLITVLLVISSYIVIYPSLKLRFEKYKIATIGILILSSFILLTILSGNNISKRFDKIIKYEKVKEAFSKNEFGDTYLWNGLNLRLIQLRAFYEIEKDENFNTFFGVGLDNGQELLNKKYKQYKMYTGKPWEKNGGYLIYNFHDQYAQTLIELGVLGFLLLIYILYSLIQKAKNDGNYFLFFIVFIIILIMFTESILVRQKGIMIFVLFPFITIKMLNYNQEKGLI